MFASYAGAVHSAHVPTREDEDTSIAFRPGERQWNIFDW